MPKFENSNETVWVIFKHRWSVRICLSIRIKSGSIDRKSNAMKLCKSKQSFITTRKKLSSWQGIKLSIQPLPLRFYLRKQKYSILLHYACHSFTFPSIIDNQVLLSKVRTYASLYSGDKEFQLQTEWVNFCVDAWHEFMRRWRRAILPFTADARFQCNSVRLVLCYMTSR